MFSFLSCKKENIGNINIGNINIKTGNRKVFMTIDLLYENIDMYMSEVKHRTVLALQLGVGFRRLSRSTL